MFLDQYRKPYNIAFVSAIPFIGGAEISTLLLLKYLDREKLNPICIIPDLGILSDRLKNLGVKYVVMTLEQIKLPFPYSYFKTVWNLSKFIKKNEIDLLVCTHQLCNQYSLPAAKLNRIPIVCHTRNLIPNFRSFWRTFLHFPDVLIANSKATAESYSHYIGKHQKVEVVYNGVDIQEYSPSMNGSLVRKRYGIDDNKFLIGMVSRISLQKRQDIFIKAIAEVVKVCPNVCTLIVGDAKAERSEDYLRDLHRMVGDMELRDNVIFTDFVQDMQELYACLDLLVLSSQGESFGRVLIEAMAMEKPVVATATGGIVEVVEDGVTGLLVEPGDATNLAKAIIWMIENEENGKRMGKAGRKRVEKMFNIEKNVKETQKIYMDILTEHNKGVYTSQMPLSSEEDRKIYENFID